MKLATIELSAIQDLSKGKKTPFNNLFSNTDLWQECQMLENVQSDVEGINYTKLKVTIAKAGSFQTKAIVSRKKGEKASCAMLLPLDALTKKIEVTDNIKKGDKLMVTLETL